MFAALLLCLFWLPSGAPAATAQTADCGFSPNRPIAAGDGVLSGFVRDAVTQQPLAGVTVYARGFGRENVAQYFYEVYGQGKAITDPSGFYRIDGLPAGTNRGPLSYSVVVIPDPVE